MDEQEWMRRIDGHMDRIDRHLDRGDELMARNERAFIDLQSYLREATIMLGTMAAEMRVSTQSINELRREFVEEMQAQRAALFAMIDRLNGPRPSGA